MCEKIIIFFLDFADVETGKVKLQKSGNFFVKLNKKFLTGSEEKGIITFLSC